MSYCCECDARPGQCEHTGRRYLDPIVYEHVSGDTPKTNVWRVPEHEQERFDNGPRLPAYALGPRVDPRAEPETFGPVETENGERMRQTGLRVLRAKVVDYQSKTITTGLTSFEKRDLASARDAIQTLSGMAPVGALISNDRVRNVPAGPSVET
jgi:hypothetical protein